MMQTLLRCCLVLLLSAASIVWTDIPAATLASTSAAPASIAETLSFTFLTPSLGWRMIELWNGNSGLHGPLVIDRTTDGGIHWHRLSTVNGASKGTGESFTIHTQSIVFADARDGWLYGTRLFATHDGGRSWKRLPLRGAGTDVAVAGTSVWRIDASCNAQSGRCRSVLLTSSAGSDAWRLSSTLTSGTSLVRADRLHAWLLLGPAVVKNHLDLGLRGTIDGGRAWRELPMPCNRTGESLEARLVPYTAKSLWLACASEPGAGTQAHSVYRSADGGHTWRLVASSGDFGRDTSGLHNLTAQGYLNNISVSSPNDAWIALIRGTLIHTSDGGRTWRAAIPYAVANPGDGSLGPVEFVDPRHGWLLSFPNLLFRTTDSGRHWREIRLGAQP